MKNTAIKNDAKVIGQFIILTVFLVGASYFVDSNVEISGWGRLILTTFRVAFPIIGFLLIRKQLLSPSLRKWLLLALLIFAGVMLPVSPNPMERFDLVLNKSVHGLPGVLGALLVVVLANKIACGWACQLGALQDLIFRINRNPKDTKGLVKQYKVPFKVSNTIRIVFTLLVVLLALILAVDIYMPLDPMLAFDPALLGALGLAVLAFVLVASLFIYRPWCYFFCPFGLLGWLSEKYSMYKIKVDPTTCTSCQLCQKACPSNTMNAILNDEKTVPDCFMCGTCIGACPKGSVSFSRTRKHFFKRDLDLNRDKDSCA